MKNFLPKTILLLFLFLLAGIVTWLPTKADDEPTAVHLSSFELTPQNNAVRIDWSTGSEFDTAGFRIKRAAANGSEEYLNNVGDNGLIANTGSGVVGSEYSATDNQVQNGDVFTYILMEVENSGNEIELARKTVTVGILPTNTPVVVSGGSGPSGSSATSTPRPTTRASSTPTATPTTVTNTPKPTNTPRASATNTPVSVEPAASPTQNSSTTNTTRSNVDSGENHYDEITRASLGDVPEVFAEEENSGETETIAIAETNFETTQQTQEGYPGATPTTAVIESNQDYPNNSADSEPTNTPIPVIGSNQGYTGAESDSPTNTANPDGTASANRGRVFLWAGFIVALLIFTTGLIGSIILFTRKAN